MTHQVKSLRGWLIGLAVFLLLLVGAIASAGPSHAAPVGQPLIGDVYTLDATGFSGDATEVIKDWSNHTDVTLVAGTCDSGNRCIQLTNVNGNTPCGITEGCSWRDTDGSCFATVQAYVQSGYGTAITTVVGKHEVGHCLGLWHLANVRCIMHSPLDPYRYPKRLCAEERSISRSLH